MEKRQYEGAMDFAHRVMEGRDLFTHMHECRTAELSVALAKHLEVDDSQLILYAQGARIHDVGKMLLPIELLTKPGRISDMEYKYLQQHVAFGERLVEPLGVPGGILDIVTMHHERMDGSGYPRGMKNGEIPLCARVTAVADMTEAMLADRPYRRSLGLPRVLEIINEQQGRELDPEVVIALHKVVDSGNIEWLN